MLGRYKIAEILCRAGLHLSASTVKRCIDEPPNLAQTVTMPPEFTAPQIVTSKYPNHVWGGDITLVPTAKGLALGVELEAIPQEHPYCFHVFNVMDHFSRRLMGSIAFTKNPTAADIVSAMEQAIAENGVLPKHIIFDHGTQFYCTETLDWCKDKNIKPRFGAVGKHGSIAVVERLHLSMKNECTRRILVPIDKAGFSKEITLWREWYNSYRPHQTLLGKTPDEVYFCKRSANSLPRIEPRPKVHHSTPCARPRMIMAGKPGANSIRKLRFLKEDDICRFSLCSENEFLELTGCPRTKVCAKGTRRLYILCAILAARRSCSANRLRRSFLLRFRRCDLRFQGGGHHSDKDTTGG